MILLHIDWSLFSAKHQQNWLLDKGYNWQATEQSFRDQFIMWLIQLYAIDFVRTQKNVQA